MLELRRMLLRLQSDLLKKDTKLQNQRTEKVKQVKQQHI